MRFSHCTFFIVENPSAALSKKRLNAFNKSDGSRTYIQDKSCLELSSVLQKCRECKSSYNNPSKHSQVLCRFHAFRRYVAAVCVNMSLVSNFKCYSCSLADFCVIVSSNDDENMWI